MATLIEKFPAHKLDDARHALEISHARLVRAAAKAGQAAPAAPTLAVKAERVLSRCKVCKTQVDGFAPADHRCFSTNVDQYDGCSWVTIAMLDLELVAERPALAGWVFLAAVEPLEGGNLIRQVPGADVADGELAPWRDVAIACDHCKASRRRTETFVVRADGSDPAVPAGTYRQVGRQCVAAFLGGKSAASIVGQLAWPDVVRGVGDEDGDGGWGGGRAAEVLNPTHFLAVTAAVIRLDGWMSRGQARERGDGHPSTSDHVLNLLTPPYGGDPKGDWRREVERCAPTAEDRERGAAALQWAADLAGNTDYERNLSLVARQKGLKRDHAGILASAVPAYARSIGNEIERRRQAEASAANPSAHVGAVGERMNLLLTVQRVASIETERGALRIISMRDNSNNLFVWKTGAANPQPGEALKIRGSVKKHDQYRGEKQTILTRCDVVDEFPPAAPARKPRAKKSKTGLREWSIGERAAIDGPGGGVDGVIERVEPGELAPIVYVRLASGALAAASPGFLREVRA